MKTPRKPKTITEWVNSLSAADMAVIYNVIDPMTPEERAEYDALTDDQLLAELEVK
jgi:hypothetical protein